MSWTNSLSVDVSATDIKNETVDEIRNRYHERGVSMLGDGACLLNPVSNCGGAIDATAINGTSGIARIDVSTDS